MSGEIIYVTDPHDGKSLGLEEPRGQAHLITMSHRHFDHDKARLFKTEKTKVLQKAGRSQFKDMEIQGIESYHDKDQGKERGKNIIFKVKLNNIKVAHLGDIGHLLTPRQLMELGEIDILFIPVGGVFTIDASTAWIMIDRIRPRVSIPMHYNIAGLSLPLDNLEDFLALAPGDHIIENVGRKKEIEQDASMNDTNVKGRIWIFSL